MTDDIRTLLALHLATPHDRITHHVLLDMVTEHYDCPSRHAARRMKRRLMLERYGITHAPAQTPAEGQAEPLGQ